MIKDKTDSTTNPVKIGQLTKLGVQVVQALKILCRNLSPV